VYPALVLEIRASHKELKPAPAAAKAAVHLHYVRHG
jgi:hypothetical protein